MLVQLDAVWYKKEKAKEQSTCEALIELTEELQIDILVVGSFGRKGERMYDTYHRLSCVASIILLPIGVSHFCCFCAVTCWAL